jgi:uncharacterized protein
MPVLLGFLISLAIGITGVGGGTITVPLLLLIVKMEPARTVGTALAFAAAVKLLVAPVYLARKQVSARMLALMLAGGLPGLAVGLYALNRLQAARQNTVLTLLLGALIVTTAALNLWRGGRSAAERGTAAGAVRDRSRWLPWVMLPVGAETGFSSAGAGALGTLALLNLTPLRPAQVVGTDVAFGLVLSLVGGGWQMGAGAYDPGVLAQLVAGGVVGALIGPHLAIRLPAKPLRVALCLWLASLGSWICWKAV